MAALTFRTIHGLTPSTQRVVYRVPDGKQAIITNLSLVNVDGANAYAVSVFVAKGSATATRIVRTSLAAATASNGNDWSSGDERWTLEPGTAIEMISGSGTQVTYALFVVEMDSP